MGRGSSKAGGGGGTTKEESTKTVSATTMNHITDAQVKSLFSSPKGTVLTIRDNYGNYIGEYTKGDGNTWIGTQKKKSNYAAPKKSVGSVKALQFEIRNMNITVK